mgnify:CR=1 FL=1
MDKPACDTGIPSPPAEPVGCPRPVGGAAGQWERAIIGQGALTPRTGGGPQGNDLADLARRNEVAVRIGMPWLRPFGHGFAPWGFGWSRWCRGRIRRGQLGRVLRSLVQARLDGRTFLRIKEVAHE